MEQAYSQLQQETSNSDLYAARFAQIVDITRGLSPVLSFDQENIGRQLKDFVVNELDIDALYTSGHWTGVLEQFMNWYIYNEENKALFISDMIKLLTRTGSEEIYASLAQKAIIATEKHNLYDLQIELAFFLLNDNRIREPEGKIAALYTLLKIRKGEKAPALAQAILPKKNTILTFYDSGCSNCTVQINKLMELYSHLQKLGYEVVSVSADSDKDIFEKYAEKLPWKDKYCDFEGFAGKDFLNYGIIGTPTFYVIDAKGIVRGRYAKVEDMQL